MVVIGDGKSGGEDGGLGGCEYGEHDRCSDYEYCGDGRSDGSC